MKQILYFIIFYLGTLVLSTKPGVALDCSKPEGIGQSTICNVQSFTAKITSGDYIPSIGFCRAHYFGKKIQRLVKRKDLKGLAKLIDEETRPEIREALINRPFEESFDEEFVQRILNDKSDFCVRDPRYSQQYYSVGGGNIWFGKEHFFRKMRIISIHFPKPLEPKFPKGWVYEGKTLHPLCFAANWREGSSSIGMTDCLEKGDDFMIQSDGFIEYSNDSESFNYDKYRVLKQISIPDCNELSDDYYFPINGRCVKSYLVHSRAAGGSMGLALRTIWGLFEMDDGSKQIIPLKIRE